MLEELKSECHLFRFIFQKIFAKDIRRRQSNLLKIRYEKTRVFHFQNRLTTNFDLHETLKEVMILYGYKNIKPRYATHGISMFRPITKSRTCKKAIIPENFCVCMERAYDKNMVKIQVSIFIRTSKLQNNITRLFTSYLDQKLNLSCITGIKSIEFTNFTYYTVSKMVRYGVRFMPNWEYYLESDAGVIKNLTREIYEMEILARVTINIRSIILIY